MIGRLLFALGACVATPSLAAEADLTCSFASSPAAHVVFYDDGNAMLRLDLPAADASDDAQSDVWMNYQGTSGTGLPPEWAGFNWEVQDDARGKFLAHRGKYAIKGRVPVWLNVWPSAPSAEKVTYIGECKAP